MRKLLLLVSFLAVGCAQEEGNTQNESRAAPLPAPAPVQTATLTGLYETSGTPPSQLCITGQGRAARFGLVIRRNGRSGCSGAGTATRNGTTLRLVMTGESACAIEARLDGRSLTFPASMPSGCSYYCAPGIVMGGTRFEKTGGTRGDALRARDSVGDPLCT
jgi:hypothetical protein